MPDIAHFNYVILGDSMVGKSVFCDSLRKGSPVQSNAFSTIGASYSQRKIKTSEQQYVIGIWDTAGHERYRSVAKMYVRSAQGAIVMFDRDHLTIEELQYWIEFMKSEKPMEWILVKTKCDSREGGDGQVDCTEFESFAQKHGKPFVKCSSYEYKGVKEAVNILFEKITGKLPLADCTSSTSSSTSLLSRIRKFFSKRGPPSTLADNIPKDASTTCPNNDGAETSPCTSSEIVNKPSPEATCGLSQANPSCEIVNEATSLIGPCGGVMVVGGCRVVFPENALDSPVTIVLKSVYGGQGDKGPITPTLKCEPNGIKFNKEVAVLLHTCYLTDQPAAVEVRRSEDGNHWRTIKQLYHTDERCFEFNINGFSWFAGFYSNLERWWTMKIRKSLVCWVPTDLTAVSTKEVRCFVDDDIPDVKRKISLPENVLEINFCLKKDEEDVELSLSVADDEQIEDVLIHPPRRNMCVRNRPHDETSFKLTWKEKNHELYSITTFVMTTVDEARRGFNVRPPVEGASTTEERQSEVKLRPCFAVENCICLMDSIKTAEMQLRELGLSFLSKKETKFEVIIGDATNISIGDGSVHNTSTARGRLKS